MDSAHFLMVKCRQYLVFLMLLTVSAVGLQDTACSKRWCHVCATSLVAFPVTLTPNPTRCALHMWMANDQAPGTIAAWRVSALLPG